MGAKVGNVWLSNKNRNMLEIDENHRIVQF